jgi:replicative DNA helicase
MSTEKLFNVDVEESVLSSYLYENESFFNFQAKEKYFTGHRIHIFNAILDLLKNGFQADLVTVASKLNGIVKASYISDVTERPVSLNLDYHIGVLKNCSMLRDLHQAYTQGRAMCENGLESSEIMQNVMGMIDINEEDSYQESMSEIALAVSSDLEQSGKDKTFPGLKTGLKNLDWSIGGLRKQELIIVAARPGHGKTVFAMNTARNLGFGKKSGLIFSLEMPKKKLVQRMICDIGDIESNIIMRHDIGPEHWTFINESLEKISEFPIEINDRSNHTIDTIYMASKKSKMVNDIKFIIIDYLQLIRGWNKDGQGPKAEITRQLKMMAKELDIPVIVLCQLNREIEKREKKIPRMSDLRDAGSIEQDADVILFTHVEHDMGLAKIFIGKNREGKTGEVDGIRWEGQYFRFSQQNTGW